MLEARLEQAVILKKVLDAIKELVTDANFDCGEEGLKLQAMDNSHVALVAVHLKPDGFDKYRCDRPLPLGVNLGSLTKVLKCAKDDDRVTLKASDTADVLNLVYEARNSDRIAEYEMKLMEIDTDTLGIPDTDYDATVMMQSAEFARIVRDMSALGESVKIEVTKEGVRFSSDGEAANGSVLLKATESARERYKDLVDDNDDDDEKEKEPKEKKTKVKQEKTDKPRKRKRTDVDVKMEDGENEVEEDDGGDKPGLFKPDSEGEEEKDDEEAGSDIEEESDSAVKKRKRSTQTKKKGAESDSTGGVYVDINQGVNLTFSLKYLVNFSKSTALSNHVRLRMSNEVPLQVHYKFGQGFIQYYLAPKIGDE